MSLFKQLLDVLQNGNSFTVVNPELGEISIEQGVPGKNGYGLWHIISQRERVGLNPNEITALIYLIVMAAQSGTLVDQMIKKIKDEKFGLEKDGVLAIVVKHFKDNHKFILTGYDLNKKKKEATDAIQTVIAQYGYYPEFSAFRNQVGAVFASLDLSYTNLINNSSFYKNNLEDTMMDSILSSRLIISDLKNKIMKWTAQDPKNKQAYQQAIQLFRENFGKNPQSEADAKVIMKTAKQMAKNGQKMDDSTFAQVAQQEGVGQGQSRGSSQGQAQQQRGNTQQAQFNQGQQNNQQQSNQQTQGAVDPNNPVELFKAIQALYKSGQITKDQVEKAFQMVIGGQDGQQQQNQQQAYQQPDQTQQSSDQQNQQQEEPLAASYKRNSRVRSHHLASSKNPGVRFNRCPPGKSRFSIGSRVVYTPYKLPESVPSFVTQRDALYAGKEGVIKAIKNDIYNVEIPEDGEIVSAYGNELKPVIQQDILSARGKIQDPMREQVRDFIANIPAFKKITGTTDPLEIYKEPFEPDHVCYLHTETFENGKAYTIEFHTSPGELFADIYVVRDYDNFDITNGGYHIEDIEDQTGFDFDKIQAFITKELTSDSYRKDFSTDMRYKANKEQQEREPVEYEQGEFDFAGASFDKWSTRVAAGLSLGKGMSLQDMAIVSGLAKVLSSDYGDSDWKYEYGKKVAEEREKNYDPNSVDAFEKEAEDFYYAKGTGAIKPRRRSGIGSEDYVNSVYVKRDVSKLGSPLEQFLYNYFSGLDSFDEWDYDYDSLYEKFCQDVVNKNPNIKSDLYSFMDKVIEFLNRNGLPSGEVSSIPSYDSDKKWHVCKGSRHESGVGGETYFRCPNCYGNVSDIEEAGRCWRCGKTAPLPEGWEDYYNRMWANQSVYDAYKKTLDTTDKLTHNPLGVVDDVAAMPFKLIDKLTGRGKKAKTSASYNIHNIHGIDVESIIKSSIYDEEDYEDEFEEDTSDPLDEFIDDYSSEIRDQCRAIKDGVISPEEFESWIEEQIRTGYPRLKGYPINMIVDDLYLSFIDSSRMGFTQPTL